MLQVWPLKKKKNAFRSVIAPRPLITLERIVSFWKRCAAVPWSLWGLGPGPAQISKSRGAAVLYHRLVPLCAQLDVCRFRRLQLVWYFGILRPEGWFLAMACSGLIGDLGSQTRDQTWTQLVNVPIRNHQTTRELP